MAPGTQRAGDSDSHVLAPHRPQNSVSGNGAQVGTVWELLYHSRPVVVLLVKCLLTVTIQILSHHRSLDSRSDDMNFLWVIHVSSPYSGFSLEN